MKIEVDTSWFAYPEVPLPRVWTVRQTSAAPGVENIQTATGEALRPILADPRIAPGKTVAIGVGSRGIDNLVTVVAGIVGELKARGCVPFIVPAMGSHGGATAEGQADVLARYGITETTVGAPIRATMEVKQVGALPDGYPVFFDCHALSADAVIVVNRVKAHTDFLGDIESGPSKMCAIGLGKQKGASTIHRFGAEGLREIMPEVARTLVQSTNIVGGIALIENQFGRTAEVHGLLAKDLTHEPERALLRRARALAPRLPFQQIDVLIVDQMGKDISGSGMDTHVIGRVRMPSVAEADWDGPAVRVVCVLDLTERSHGNAAGLGLADMTTRGLIEKMDFPVTFINHRTSVEGGVQRGRLPIILEDADACARAAIGSCGRGDYAAVRLARIRDTEHVEYLQVSEPLMTQVMERGDVEIVRSAEEIDFTQPVPIHAG